MTKDFFDDCMLYKVILSFFFWAQKQHCILRPYCICHSLLNNIWIIYQKLPAVSDVLSFKNCDCISIFKSMIFWLPVHMSSSVEFPKTVSKLSICTFLLNIWVILLAFKAKHKPLVVRTGFGVISPEKKGLLIALFSWETKICINTWCEYDMLIELF